jgi:hypothetical protein
MEVHHPKPLEEHESGGHRGWRRYAGEFVMIAVAVFVGSIGEYYLEHRIMAERRDDGLELVLRNLATDRRNIDMVIDYSNEGLQFMQQMQDRAYALRRGSISRAEYLRGIEADLGKPYEYRTLFLDQAGFKLMSSSGLVSIVASDDLKVALSAYYEVLGRRVEDNNRLLDAEASRFYADFIPARDFPGREQPTDGPQVPISFLLGLPFVSDRLASDRFLLDSSTVITRIVVYRNVMRDLREQNETLDALIRRNL